MMLLLVVKSQERFNSTISLRTVRRSSQSPFRCPPGEFGAWGILFPDFQIRDPAPEPIKLITLRRITVETKSLERRAAQVFPLLDMRLDGLKKFLHMHRLAIPVTIECHGEGSDA